MALALVGSPYANGGASPEAGFDCSGLVAYVYARALRRELPRNTFDLARTGAAVGDPQPGDLLFYNTQGRPFSHVGIYLGESRFVHAPSTGGVVRIEDMRPATGRSASTARGASPTNASPAARQPVGAYEQRFSAVSWCRPHRRVWRHSNDNYSHLN